jgi:hypothetical protein
MRLRATAHLNEWAPSKGGVTAAAVVDGMAFAYFTSILLTATLHS